MADNNLYGFENSNDVVLDAQGLPVGTYKAMIIGEEAAKDDKGVVAEFEVLDGDNKGKTGKVWYLTKHDNALTANIAKQNLKRIAEATGKPLTPMAPLKNRVLTIEVRQQKKNPQYTEVAKYLPENYIAEAEIPA
jgi:ribosomal protein L24